MRRILLIFGLMLALIPSAMGRHIKGGWVRYEYLGAPSSTSSSYRITIHVFKVCGDNGGPMPSSLNVYDASSYATALTVGNIAGSFRLIATPNKTNFGLCLNNPPVVCYQIYEYTTTITLPNNSAGYIIAAQDAYRISGIVNIVSSSSTGITFSATIPGVINNEDFHINSNPDFKFTDTVIICYNAEFNYQFTATDADGDSLSYAFGNGINGTQAASSPPYSSVTYAGGFSGARPLGPNVSIDAATGLITGRSPTVAGEYVVAVYVSEWRKGVLINTTRKELQVSVNDCSLSAAALAPDYLNCDDFSFTFSNKVANATLNSFYWDFGDKTSSTQAIASHSYTDTGTYLLKLKVANALGCQDSATAVVKVYPGFTPAVEIIGSCSQAPFVFSDKTVAKYGRVNKWFWDFGEPALTTDTSSAPIASFQYGGPGTYTLRFAVESSLGCKAELTQTVKASGKPAYVLPFADTLICSIDSLPLRILTNASVQWTPVVGMIGQHTKTPIVFPKTTTTYQVIVKEAGCADTASVKVNVLDFVSVNFSADPYLCKGDSITLKPVSDALSYLWSEKGGTTTLTSATVKFPSAFPTTTTTYYVSANLGYCQDRDSVTVFVAPYPMVNAGADTVICTGDQALLPAKINADKFYWGTTAGLTSTGILQPKVQPVSSTTYRLFVYDTSYCRKIVFDDITVKVIPPILLNAGRDTAVVIGQPLQFGAQSRNPLRYSWAPAIGLNDPDRADPIAMYTAGHPTVNRYTVTGITTEGCVGIDDITVKVFQMEPDILVPTAFTPNHDGRNETIHPIPIGLRGFRYFRVVDRWGQLIFQTAQPEIGWDGNLNGRPQPTQTFTYMAEGEDFSGRKVFRKGTFILIR